MDKGRFIVFEGIDGSGTTTQASMLADWCAREGIKARLTREPTDGRVGKLIREYLSGAVDVADLDRHYHILALLFAADRLDHLAREVEPCLEEGYVVISDRYLLSSIVYQSLHCDREWVRAINDEALPADVTFLLDAPVELTMERIARRGLFGGREIYETEEQQEKLRALYLRAIREKYSERETLVLDGSPSPEEVHARVLKKLGSGLKPPAGG